MRSDCQKLRQRLWLISWNSPLSLLSSLNLHFNQELFRETKWVIWGGSLCEKGKLFRIEMKLNKKCPWKVFLFFSGIIALEDWEQVLLVVCRSWQTPYFWSPEPASWCPLGFNTKQWTVNFQSKVLMEATRKTSCCNAKAGSKVWLWQMLNVDGGRGESSLLLLYNSSYNLLHRQTPFPPVAALQPRSLLLPARVDACGLASGSCISLLFSLHHFILNSLYIFSLIDLLAEAAEQPHSQRPPIKRLVGPTLLFGRHPFLY